MPDDADILLLFEKRSQNAIAEIQNKYGARCLAMAESLLGNRQDAEECVSDTMLRLWETIPPARPQNLGGYCMTLCRRIALDRRRRLRAEKRGGGQVALCVEELSDCLSDSLSPDDLFDRRQTAAALARFLDQLPAQTRVMFVLRYWSCMSVQQIARECGCGVSKVKMTLLRTRKKLRDYFAQEGYV